MNEIDIIKKAQEGDRKALDEILTKYGYIAKECAKRYFLVGYDEDDLIQEGMIALFYAIKDYKDDRDASFKTFAYLCVDRRLKTKVKESFNNKNKALNSSISVSTLSDEDSLDKILPVEYMINAEEEETISIEKLHELIENELTSFEQKVTNSYLEGKKYQDIAKELNKNIKSIDGALQRAKTKLRNAYKG